MFGPIEYLSSVSTTQNHMRSLLKFSTQMKDKVLVTFAILLRHYILERILQEFLSILILETEMITMLKCKMLLWTLHNKL